jgi:hypothetical protein
MPIAPIPSRAATERARTFHFDGLSQRAFFIELRRKEQTLKAC